MAVMENSMNITIDKEFKALIPSLSDEERAGLEESLKTEGCRDALVVWSNNGKHILLDGHNRKAICDKHRIKYKTTTKKLADRTAAKIWIIENQLARRNLPLTVRIELAFKLEPLLAAHAKQRQKEHGKTAPGRKKTVPAILPEVSPRERETRTQVAKIAGVSPRTVSKAKVVLDKADEKTKKKLRRGETTINKEYKAIQRKDKEKQREHDKKERRKKIDKESPKLSDRVELYCCDVRDALKHVKAGSVDWVVTDPPYPEKFVSLFGVLGKVATKVLKPGGGLLCMSGQTYLPEVMSLLSKSGLSYQWTLAYLTPGGQAVQIHPRKVNTFWKPIFWFTKGRYKGNWIGDVTKSDVNANEKLHHHWGQSESGMYDLMSRFVKPGDLVLDPFVGGGTTGVVALELGCRFVGSDIDEELVKRCEKRLCD